MKQLICLIGLAAFSAANAQDAPQESKGYGGKTTNKTFIWSIGVEPSIPLGSFKDYSGFGLGGSLQGEYKPGKRVGITVNAGYIDYFGKTVNDVNYPDFKYWPVMGGLKLYLSNMFYIHGQAGPGFGTNGLGTSFWYGGGLGFNIGRAVDAEIKYTGWKQNEVSMASDHGGGTGGGNGGGYGTGGGTGTGGTGGTGTGGGTGGYGGHYPTIGLRLAYNF